MTNKVYLLLGSNEGDREAMLLSAIDELAREAAAGAVLQSSLYETAAWGIEEQPPFLNIAVGFETALSPEDLLQIILSIEAKWGRQRTVAWGQRTLDIDILFFGDLILNTAKLTIPHPQLPNRRFALIPLCAIAPEVIHPVLHVSSEALLQHCSDTLQVRLYHTVNA